MIQNKKQIFSFENKLQLKLFCVFWLCYFSINIFTTVFFSNEVLHAELILHSLLYSTGGFIFSWLGYHLIKVCRVKITSNLYFVLLSILTVYLTTFLWMISHHFSWWFISGKGIFTIELKLYPIKALIYSVIILAAILLLLITEIKNLSVIKNDNNKMSTFNLSNFQDLFENKEIDYEETLLLPIKNKILNVKVNSIKLIQANDYYSKVTSEAYDKTILNKYSLKKWETFLPDKHFVRIHRSTIVNINYIENIEKMYNNTYEVKVKGVEQSATMSRRCAKTVLDKFQL